MTDPKILVVFNPSSQGGNSSAIFQRYQDFLAKNSISYRVYETNGLDDLAQLKALLIDDYSIKTISVVGGDGTLNLVINASFERSIALHVIPAGSGNDFVKMIYPDYSLEEIFSLTLKSNMRRPVDIWKCNNDLFINAFGVGFDGALIQTIAGNNSFLPAKLKYWVAILKNIFFYQSQEYQINGIPKKSFMLTLANGQVFGGDFKIAPTAHIDDRQLDFIEISKIWTPLRLIYLPLLQLGKHLKLGIVIHSQVDHITIESTAVMFGQMDGEFIQANKFEVSFAGQVEVLSR